MRALRVSKCGEIMAGHTGHVSCGPSGQADSGTKPGLVTPLRCRGELVDDGLRDTECPAHCWVVPANFLAGGPQVVMFVAKVQPGGGFPTGLFSGPEHWGRRGVVEPRLNVGGTEA